MSGSVFAIGSEPRLTAYDAETLARFLELAGSERAFELSSRIRHGNTRGERIALDRDDLDVLLELFRKALICWNPSSASVSSIPRWS
jgi:hypothetical protein